MRRLLGFVILVPIATHLFATSKATAGEPTFERIVIDNSFPGAYQVELADVNGDKKLDIIALGGGTCAWFENPTWKKRIITDAKQSPGVISSATADIDGDGKAEVAIAYEFEMNQPKRGKLLLAMQGPKIDDPWTTQFIADVGSIHRVRWADFSGEKKPELVVAPIFGPSAKPPTYDQDPAKIEIFTPGAAPKSGNWKRRLVAERLVLHSIEVTSLSGAPSPNSILTADNLGVRAFETLDKGTNWSRDGQSLTPGAKGEAPKRGASEVHLGRLSDQSRFVTTIEPWHGNQVAVCTSSASGQFSDTTFARTVIDDTLDDGHALCVADVDRDGTDEVFAGHRGKDHRVSMYKFDGKTWNKTVLDREIAAQDLRSGDVNGDGKPDLVSVGGATHNVILYRTK